MAKNKVARFLWTTVYWSCCWLYISVVAACSLQRHGHHFVHVSRRLVASRLRWRPSASLRSLVSTTQHDLSAYCRSYQTVLFHLSRQTGKIKRFDRLTV